MKEMIEDLQFLLHTKEQWVKVHAAEYLLWLGYRANVRELFMEEDSRHGQQPKFRIGVWRILAQAETTAEGRTHWETKIVSVFNDTAAPDRLHAIESLAKLKISVPGASDIFRRGFSEDNIGPFELYAVWNAAYDPEIGKDRVRAVILNVLERSFTTGNNLLSLISTYILRYLSAIPTESWQQLKKRAMVYAEDPELRAGLLATTWITAGAKIPISDVADVKSALFQHGQNIPALSHLLAALAAKGGRAERTLANQIYLDVRSQNDVKYDPDMHATAAYALLAIHKRCT